MKKILIFLILPFTFLTNAQDFNSLKMDSLFTTIEKNNKGMGNLSIFLDGKEIYNKSVGFSDYANKKAINALTKFRIGSISKSFTAAIIMQMVEEGKLQLEQTIDKYFKDFPQGEKIVVEQLLRHRSGIHNFTSDSAYMVWMTQPKTTKELYEIIKKGGIDFAPGTKTEYSNSNYVLLSMIAEKIDKKTFPEILNSRILKPLKLTNTGYGKKIQREKNEALSYDFLKDWSLSTETDMSIPMGAGAIISTPFDLNSFYNALFNEKVIKKSSLDKMTNLVDGMGLGIFAFPFYDKKAFGHNGGIDGFLSTAAYFQNEKLGIAYCSNGVAMPMNDILIGVLSIYFDREYKIPDFKTIELKSEDLDCYLGVYSDPGFPMKIMISKDGATLIAQAEGQSAFQLDAFEKHKFRYDQAGIILEFIPEENKMILKQGGGVFELIKEK